MRRRSREAESQSVNRRMLLDALVGSDQIDNLAVLNRHLWPESVDRTKLGAGAVELRHIGDDVHDLLGKSTIEHVTLHAVTSQTIAAGGGTVQFDTEADEPTERRGFDTLATELESGSVGDIPVDVGGYIHGEVELPFASTVDVDSWKVQRLRDGILTTFFPGVLSGTGIEGVRGPFWGLVYPGDFIRCTLDPSADVDLSTPAGLVLGIWRLASATSSTTETLWLDTASATDPSVTSDTVLASGQTYTILIDGNCRLIDGALGAAADDILYVSPGQSDDLANIDADYKYASDPDSGTQHLGSFCQFDLGSGFSHVEPDGGAATEAPDGHLYRYTVTGEGSALSVQLDTAQAENNGQFRIRIYQGAV